MTNLETQQLSDIDEVETLGTNDTACLEEIKDVLRKHGKLDRFGITLLHDHFPMVRDELLVETCDHQNRILTLRPMTSVQRAGLSLVETSWRLSDGAALTGCYRACVTGSSGHAWKHVTR